MEKFSENSKVFTRILFFLRAVEENKNYYMHMNFNGVRRAEPPTEARKIFNNFIRKNESII